MTKRKTSHNQARKLKSQTNEGRLYYKTENTEYGLVTKKLGDRRILCYLVDGSEMLAIIPGKFRKKVWIDIGNIILLSRRLFQDNKMDVILRYSPKEARQLCKEDHIPQHFIDGETVEVNDLVAFDSSSEDDGDGLIDSVSNDENVINVDDL